MECVEFALFGEVIISQSVHFLTTQFPVPLFYCPYCVSAFSNFSPNSAHHDIAYEKYSD